MTAAIKQKGTMSQQENTAGNSRNQLRITAAAGKKNAIAAIESQRTDKKQR